MKKNVSNISFTSNIKFVSTYRQRRIADMSLLGTKFVNEMHSIKKVGEIKKLGVTEEIIFCLAGVVQNLKTKSCKIFHWSPKKLIDDNKECLENSEKLGRKLRKISSKNNFKGVLFGLISEYFPEQNKSSKKLIKFLKNNFKIPNKGDYTAFLFQDSKGLKTTDDWPKINFTFCKKNDTYYVSCRKSLNGKEHDLLTKEEIRNHFGVILPSPNDKIFIGNEHVPNCFWTKFKKSDLVDLY